MRTVNRATHSILRRALSLDAPEPGRSPTLKAALNSTKDYHTAGLMGVPITVADNSIPVGRVYRYDAKNKTMVAASDWINVGAK